MINQDNLITFQCPVCKAGFLEEKTDNNGESILKCNNCNEKFPVIFDIPRLTSLENYSASFGFQWNKYQATQLDSYTKTRISEDRIKKATFWDDLNDVSGNILEAGSGAGRFTEVLTKTSANVYSFDYSNAVEANYKNNGESTNLKIFQGDIFNIPFKDDEFDHVFCLGVIQHTPNPEKAFKSLAQKVKPGGYLYIDHYAFKWHHIFSWQYMLRPITKRIKKETLYNIISKVVPKLIPVSRIARKYLGRLGSRLIPIVEFSHLGLDKSINEEWAILDTFDIYSPEHDHPQTISTIKTWFQEISFDNVSVFYGDNGIVAQGRKPLK